MPVQLEKSNPYTIGFDLGNSTVASAVINADFNVIRKDGEVMDHVNLFTRGNGKADRRAFRSARRGVSHKKWLKKQLYRNFLAHQIDGNIQQIQERYKTSWISKKDQKRLDRKSVKLLYLLQTKLYPSVWFAVKALIDNDEGHLPKDVCGREALIYEVFHNLLGRRGHFLMPNLKVDAFVQQAFDFNDLFEQLHEESKNNLGLELGNDFDQFKSAMVMSAGILKRRDALLQAIQNKDLSSTEKQRIKLLAALCAGSKLSEGQLAKLFSLKKEASGKLQLGSADVDQQLDDLDSDLSDTDMAIIEMANKVFYQAQLSEVQRAGMSFVDTQIANYHQFGEDLVLLKKTILPNLKSDNDRSYYANRLYLYLNSEGAASEKYRKKVMAAGSEKKQGDFKPLTQNEFVNDMVNLKKAKFIKPLDQLISADDFERLGTSRFLAKTRSTQNAWIPQQAIQSVIRQIIDTQKHVKGLEWLGEQKHADPWFGDEKYDLERFYDFRIPYYVGPLDKDYSLDDLGKLSKKSEYSWLKRRDNGTLTIFNFTQKVDLVASAREFINKLQAKDTYLLDEPVMPASSMTYQKFTVLDELNHLTLKVGSHYRKLTTEQKLALLNLFKQSRTVSLIMAFRCLQTEFNILPDVNPEVDASKYLRGLSQASAKMAGNKAKFNNSFSTYLKWKHTYGFTDQQIADHYDDFEKIAECLTVFDRDSKLIKKTVLRELGWLTEEQIDRLSKDSLEGWGRLSKKLLTGIYDEYHNSVLDLMTDTSKNLIQAITEPAIKKQIDEHQEKLLNHQGSRREAIEALLDRNYASPAVRKVIQRFASHLLGVVKRMKYAPAMVVIESAREDGTGRNNTTQVSNQINKVVKEMEPSICKEWKSLSKDEKHMLTLKQRLYFEQNGRDIYTGEPFDFNNLSAQSHIDHVIPQNMYKDNSLSNKVLTFKDKNMTKGGDLCAIQVATSAGRELWRKLYNSGLMSKTKYNNLQINWNDPQNGHLVVGMLRRSLVETHQVNKLAAQVATMLLQNYGTKVLTMRADVTTLLRENSNFKDVKNRDANDLHHGVDAFLVAFAGQYLWRRYDYLHGILDYNDYSKIKLPAISIRNVGFGELINGSDEDLIVNKNTGEIVGQRGHLMSRIDCFNQNTIKVHFEHGPAAASEGNMLAKATIHPAAKFGDDKNYLPVQGHDPAIYGYRKDITRHKMVLIHILKGRQKGKYCFVTIPQNCLKRIDWVIVAQTSSVKSTDDYEILRDDLEKFDEFEIPYTGIKLAANGGQFQLRNEMHYPVDLLREINQDKYATVDELKELIKELLQLIKNQYAYMLRHRIGSNFTKLADLDVDGELAKETDPEHLREIIHGLLVGFSCSSKRNTVQIGDVNFSRLGDWSNSFWDNVKMMR